MPAPSLAGVADGWLVLSTDGLAPGYYRVEQADPARPAAPRRGGVLGEVLAARATVFGADPGEELAPFRSFLATPLDDGAWCVLLREDAAGWREDERERATLTALALGFFARRETTARELDRARAWISRETEQIAAIQRALLPEQLPRVPGLALAAGYQTFDLAGGDFYDVWPLARGPDGDSFRLDGPWGLLVADASGHGPAAAVVIAMLHAMLHAAGPTAFEPARVLDRLNRGLFEKRVAGSFVTAWLAVYDPPARTLRYARAGHNPPLLRHADTETVDALDAVGGVPLGVLPEAAYEEASLSLQPGQTLLLYTDGVTETRSREGVPFGEEGIARALALCKDEDPDCVVRTVQAVLRDYEGGGRPSDDQTMLAIRVLP